MEDIKNITIADLIDGVSADKELKDKTYDTMPMFNPEVYDPAEDGDNTNIQESIQRKFQADFDNLILNEDKLIENKTTLNEVSSKVIAMASFLNSHSPAEQNFETYKAEGFEAQVPFGNAKNFASFKSQAKAAGLLTNGGQGGANVRNVDTGAVSATDIAQQAGLVQRELTPEEQEAVDAMTAIQKTRSEVETDFTPEYTGNMKFAQMEQMMKSFLKGRVPPLTVIAGAPGVGKTYTINKVIDQYCGAGASKNVKRHPIAVPNSKDKLVWAAGTTKGGISGTLLECFKYRNHYAVIYNDCDRLLNVGADGANVLKNIFDSDMDNRYTNVPSSLGGGKQGEITKLYQDELSGLDESAKQGKVIGIDMKALKEDAILTVTCDGKVIEDSPLSIKEAVTVLKEFGEKPNFKFLKESWASELKESVFDDIDPDDTDEDIDTDNTADIGGDDELLNDDYVEYDKDHGVSKFLFNSRFMFITNKHKSDLDEAVRDRAYLLDIVLTPEEYLARLASVKDKIVCNNGNNDKSIEAPARDIVYRLIKTFIIVAKTGTMFDGKRISIAPNQLTFRMYDSAVTKYCQLCEIFIGDPKYGVTTLEEVQNDGRFSRLYYDFLDNLLSGREER